MGAGDGSLVGRRLGDNVGCSVVGGRVAIGASVGSTEGRQYSSRNLRRKVVKITSHSDIT